jgi:hypothetical protein
MMQTFLFNNSVICEEAHATILLSLTVHNNLPAGVVLYFGHHAVSSPDNDTIVL